MGMPTPGPLGRDPLPLAHCTMKRPNPLALGDHPWAITARWPAPGHHTGKWVKWTCPACGADGGDEEEMT